jgi:GWxTD domain-containing protein
VKKYIYSLTLCTPQLRLYDINILIFMKKYFFILLLCNGLAHLTVAAANVTAYLTYGSFSSPAKGQYIETYTSVIGNTLKFVKNANGKYQGAVDISVVFKLNDEIKNAKKYTLNSPEIADTLSGMPNFIDEQRYTLANGRYEMELSIADKNKPLEKPFITKVPINIEFADNLVNISSIQLLESYTKSTMPSVLTKNGYDLMPYVSTFFPENINKIKFYTEIYNSKKVVGDSQKIILNYFIESFDKKVKLSDYSAFSKQTTNDVNMLLTEFNIASLPSGNYNLVVEIRDKENKLQASNKCFIQRQNKPVELNMDDLKSINVATTFVNGYINIDSMAFYIKSLRPISSKSEIQFAENQLKGRNLELMQQYFYNFWRARNVSNTEIAWLEYYKEVRKVNKEFGTYGLRGFDTDRGRVYLQYGAPDQRTKYDKEPSALPYEIWEYYSLVDKTQVFTNPDNKQSSKNFVFYNPDLVSNKYVLLHSDARGEPINTRWDLVINKRNIQNPNMDAEKAPENYGGNAQDNYNNPR